MKILYCGDSAIGGPANYLLGVLIHLRSDFVHLPPSENLKPELLTEQFDAIILSDFTREHVSDEAQKQIAEQVKNGAGLLMIGGWGSFGKPFGNYQGSIVEGLLPVKCVRGDDRANFPGGALITEKTAHPMFKKISFKDSPVLCGMNRVQVKKGSEVLLTAKKIIKSGENKLSLDRSEYPLFVISGNPKIRAAALTTDVAPHWCGGLVDWGKSRMRLTVTETVWTEVGDCYVKFISAIISWTAGR